MFSHSIRAGVARQLITPPAGIFLVGYGDRTKGNQGVYDDLTATALVLDDGERRLALVACDLLCLNEYVVDRIRRKVGLGTDLIVCCSHTHSGPIGYAGEGVSSARRRYINTLVDRVGQAVTDAAASLQPAWLGWSQGVADIAVNRRERKADGHIEIGINPDGVIDRSVNVLSVFGEAGKRLATLVNFACHGTVLGPDNLLVSADWIGAMRRGVESELGGLCLFLQGATGDLNPEMGWGTSGVWDLLQRQADRVAGAVVEACSTEMKTFCSVPLGLVRQEVWLPFEIRADTPKPPATYRRRLLEMAHLPSWMFFLTDALLDERYPWCSRILARDGYWGTLLRVNSVRMGDLALVTFGSETFTEIGMAIKQLSPAQYTMFASISDGCIGYLPTAAAHADGGFEVDLSPYSYRYPGRFEAHCEELALDAARRALEALYGAGPK